MGQGSWRSTTRVTPPTNWSSKQYSCFVNVETSPLQNYIRCTPKSRELIVPLFAKGDEHQAKRWMKHIKDDDFGLKVPPNEGWYSGKCTEYNGISSCKMITERHWVECFRDMDVYFKPFDDRVMLSACFHGNSRWSQGLRRSKRVARSQPGSWSTWMQD